MSWRGSGPACLTSLPSMVSIFACCLAGAPLGIDSPILRTSTPSWRCFLTACHPHCQGELVCSKGKSCRALLCSSLKPCQTIRCKHLQHSSHTLASSSGLPASVDENSPDLAHLQRMFIGLAAASFAYGAAHGVPRV